MSAAAADVDGDEDLDIIVAVEFGENIVLLNDGSARFRHATNRLPNTKHDTEDIGIADFDEDGDLDIIFVSEDDRTNELLLNDGSGHFSDATVRLGATGTSNAVLIVDFNEDSQPDILIGNNGQNALLINQGGARFTDETALRLPDRVDITQDIASGDIDRDGDIDLLIANEGANRILINVGDGRFVDESIKRLPMRKTTEETRKVALGDIDGDSDLDIFFANIGRLDDGAAQNRLLINDGTGVYSDETAARIPTDSDWTFFAGFYDIDYDGDQDIVTANTRPKLQPANYQVYQNEGSGSLQLATESFFSPRIIGKGFSVVFADFNGDGANDFYFAARKGSDKLMLATIKPND